MSCGEVTGVALIPRCCACGVGYSYSYNYIGYSYNSNSTPSLGTSMCHECGPKKTKQNKTKQNKQKKPHEKWNKLFHVIEFIVIVIPDGKSYHLPHYVYLLFCLFIVISHSP